MALRPAACPLSVRASFALLVLATGGANASPAGAQSSRAPWPGPTGEIFVADGEASNDRIVKFSGDGRYLTEWGTSGSGPSQFDNTHDLPIDAGGRVFVADRGNGLDQWTGFGHPSGISLNRATNVLYSTDSQSQSGKNPGVRRGIYIGNALTGDVTISSPIPTSSSWTGPGSPARPASQRTRRTASSTPPTSLLISCACM